MNPGHDWNATSCGSPCFAFRSPDDDEILRCLWVSREVELEEEEGGRHEGDSGGNQERLTIRCCRAEAGRKIRMSDDGRID